MKFTARSASTVIINKITFYSILRYSVISKADLTPSRSVWLTVDGNAL